MTTTPFRSSTVHQFSSLPRTKPSRYKRKNPTVKLSSYSKRNPYTTLTMSSNDSPPTYSQATGSSTTGSRLGDKPKGASSNIPPHDRRSMEDENRDLPTGWVRTYDPKNSHQFFVDTTSNPPRSICKLEDPSRAPY